MPWVNVTFGQASTACRAAGKSLCDQKEWNGACQGPDRNGYPYGDTYIADMCNGDAYGAGAPFPTGSLSGCEGGVTGLFDMSGDVWEWVRGCIGSGTNLCPIRGGSYIQNPNRVQCREEVDVDDDTRTNYIGFRCCLRP